jgi:DNA mismatch repair protein MutS
MTSLLVDEEKLSPMMQQWHSCKKQAGPAILFFRLGDFYEAFYEDASLIAKELDLTLTKRQDVPMAGVPFHTSETYIDKLVTKGYRVAIAEQMEDPKNVKGIVKREIVRIITPGTVVNSSLLSDKANNFLASITFLNHIYGLSVLDLTTAEFRVFEFEDPSLLYDELSRLQPREILVSQKCYQHQSALFEDLKSQLSCVLQIRENWHFDPQHTYDFLARHFHVHSLDGFGLKGMTSCIHAAGCLLSYVQDELNVSIQHVHSIQKETSNLYMSLDGATLRHLEILESMHEKQSSYTLLHLLDKTATPMGGRLLKHWIVHPLLSPHDIKERQDTVEWFLRFPSFSMLTSALAEIRDLERLMMKIETGFAGPKDLLGLRLSLEQIPTVFSLLKDASPSLLQRQLAKLSDVDEIVSKIRSALVEEPPFRLSDGRVFKAGYHAELDEYREIAANSHEWIARYQVQLRESSQIKNLKVGFTKAFGYYIEVSRGQSDKIPSSFQRRQTLVNAERFITPELRDYEHKVLSAEEKIAAIELDLFHALRKEVSSHATQVREIASALAHIDCLAALTKLANEQSYVRPLVDEGDLFHIEAGRHPVIEASLRSESFIPNDVFLDASSHRLLVITGPNMAGKSTYIRQVALIAILAQIGSFVPAKKAHIGIIDKVFTRIGASDNLSRGQSTFMVEMSETANILHNATNRSLVVLDEIGRGTSTYDGISIAWAVAEYLLTTKGKKAKTLFATHYCELTQLEDQIPGAVNYNVAVHESDKGIVFLRKILKGGTDKSYGIHVARLAGLPSAVLAKAQERLKDLEKGSPKKRNEMSKIEKTAEQLNLFPTIEPQNEEILEDLKRLDLNHTTPVEALLKLSEWKNKLLH